MKSMMRVAAVVLMGVAGVAGGAPDLVVLEPGAWLADPLTWKFGREGISVGSVNSSTTAYYQSAPLSGEVEVEALVTPHESSSRSWSLAGVALTYDHNNYWYLALVAGPAGRSNSHKFEICQVVDGQKFVQGNLRQSGSSGSRREGWSYGESYKLRLALGGEGIRGSVCNREGEVLWSREYVFTGEGIKGARPALQVRGFRVDYGEVRAGWDKGQVVKREGVAPYVSLSGGVSSRVKGRATGFFHVEQMGDGRWWTIDPLGQGVVVLGSDFISYQGRPCQKLGYAPYGRNNDKKYADRAAWEVATLERLGRWGFNALGAGCDPTLKHRGLLHTEFLRIGHHMASREDEYNIVPYEGRPGSDFPNVFHPGFRQYAEFRARQVCAAMRDDPWLFGYFIDNELAWWGRGAADTGLADAVMRKDGGHTAKIALRRLAESSFKGSVAKFNEAFGSRIGNFDEILELKRLPHVTQRAVEFKVEFLALAAEEYFRITAEAVRGADPNHMVLGARFAGIRGAHPVIWRAAGRHCDAVTFNLYPYVEMDEGVVYNNLGPKRRLVSDILAELHGHVKRPMLLTEWSFPALDSIPPSLYGAGQRFETQAERGRASAVFAATILSLPFMLGYNYFMWADQPALGVSLTFPEDSNYGLVNELDEPYPILTKMFERLHGVAAEWRFRPLPVAKAGAAPLRVKPVLEVVGKGGVAGVAGRGEAVEGAFKLGQAVQVSGRVGGSSMLDRIYMAGREESLGRFNPLLHFTNKEGRTFWLEPQRVVSAKVSRVDGIEVVEMSGEYAKGGVRFELMSRFYVDPEREWFLCEWCGVKNSGSEPLKLNDVFFRLYSSLNDTAKVAPKLWPLPPADSWMDHESGVYIGLVAPKGADSAVEFKFTSGGGQRPESKIALDGVVVEAGKEFVPEVPIYMVCSVGGGGVEGWKKRILELDRVLNK